MTRLINEYRDPAMIHLSWRWECQEHGWHGLWELHRDCAREGGIDHDVHFHGLDPDEEL